MSGAVNRAKLSDFEVFWRDHQKWLQERGYMLRPRYMPDWKASWLTSTKKPYFMCEDGGIPILASTLMDATRISDGAYVALKSIQPSVHPYEVEIGTYLSSEPLGSDPQNHCVPIYEILDVPDVDDRVILVMPLLRKYNRPPLQTFGESVDFFQQMFEGLQFMHNHHVAHRDCMSLNIMMDGSMYPDGWHPCSDWMKRDYSDDVKPYTRTQRPPKYYLIDFGISRRHSPDDTSPSDYPILGGDKSVPEFRKSADKCNPYPTDVYYLGNMIRQDFMQEKSGFEFMDALIADMVQDEPTKRPTMDQVVECFSRVRKDLTNSKLRARIPDRDEGAFKALYRGLSHLGQRAQYTISGLPAVPTR